MIKTTTTQTTSDRRMAELAGDVKSTHITFKRMLTRWNNAPKNSMSRLVVADAANELYFAARKAYRYAQLHVETV